MKNGKIIGAKKKKKETRIKRNDKETDERKHQTEK